MFDGIVIVVEISTVDRSASDSCGAEPEASSMVSEFKVLDSDPVKVREDDEINDWLADLKSVCAEVVSVVDVICKMVELTKVALKDGRKRLDVVDEEESADVSEELVVSGTAT